MEGLAVTLRAPVASFRRPLDLNYQRTLLMPPPTTCIGIAGAALGLPDVNIWSRESPFKGLKVSVLMDPSFKTGGNPVLVGDLWKIMKIKDGKIAPERSPYFRELLFFARYTILFSGEEKLISQLEKAFIDPVYPLSLGREDEIALVENLEKVKFEKGKPVFSGTIVPGDFREINVRVKLAPGVRIEPPTVEKLPTEFKMVKNRVREPVDLKAFTFIPLGTEIEIPNLEAYTYKGRNFSWLNF